jgi:hypothetical protein
MRLWRFEAVPGYSTRTLSDKLGIKSGTQVIALGAPPTYRASLAPLPRGATLQQRLSANARFIHCFVNSRKQLASDFTQLAGALADDGALWISWPKTSSRVDTDLTENVIRELGLPLGLVDVKVCAIDEVWSGLKFVRRLENRSKKP